MRSIAINRDLIEFSPVWELFKEIKALQVICVGEVCANPVITGGLCVTYLVRRFPRAFGFLVVLASLNPVTLCCNSWLALVLGRRGEGFPAPGRTGVPARALLLDALRMKIPMQQYKLALKAHILMASPNHRQWTCNRNPNSHWKLPKSSSVELVA